MVLRHKKVVETFCSPVRNIFPRISLHDLPYHRTMRKCVLQISLNEGICLFLQLKSLFQTYSWNCLQYLCLFCFLVECNPKKHGQGMMLVLPNQRHSYVFSTLDPDFVSFLLFWNRPHTQTKTIHPVCYKISFHNLELFSHPFAKRTFSNCLSQKESCQRMTAQISFKKNDWIFHTGPWFGQFVFW